MPRAGCVPSSRCVPPNCISSSSDSDDDSELEGRLKTFTLQEEKCILPPSEEELEELLMKLQSMKGSLSIFEMSTTGHNKEGEEPQETMKDQKLNIKVDVEHVKLADHDTCSTASVSTMEPAECQKASIASGARRKRRSDTDLEDVQPLEKKVLCLIAMNYLHTTPPESRDECNEFQEYLLDMKVHITCVSVGSLVITVKCDSLKSLEELWEDYSCGLLSKMVRDCFVTEKILKELNLAELKLKTTMDIEEYNACKLYFEKDALRGIISSEFHSKSSTSESLQKQEELKKWERKTKIVETEKMKGTSLSTKLSIAGHGKELEGKLKTLKLKEEKSTWPVPEFSASDPEEELAELRLKPQGMEVTSPSAVYLTTGHEKEKILRHETMKLQEKKGILPLSEEEPEGLFMKLQRTKGTSLSTKLSTVGRGKELEGKLKPMKLQEEKSILPLSEEEPEGLLMKLQRRKGILPLSEEELEELLMKLQSMKGSSPSVVLPSAGQKKDLEGRQKTMKIQGEKGSLPSSPLSTTDLEEKLEEVCVKLMRLRKEGSLAIPESSTGHLLKKLAELCMELIRLRMEGTLPPPELFTATLEEELEELRVKVGRERYEGILSTRTFEKDVEKLLRQLQEKRMEDTMYPTIRSGLVKFDVSLPKELQSYASYLFNESAKLGLRKRALHSLSAVEELREAMDKYKLKTFLSIHIREGAWQVALLFMDELSSYKLPRDWFVYAWYFFEEEEETISSSLYSSTSGILKAWPTEYDPDLVTLCKAITDRDWKVTGLIFFGSRISEEGLKNLGTALTQGKLYSLTLYCIDLQSQRLEHLCEGLTSVNCNLTSLNFSDNELRDEEIMRLCNVLTSVNCKLTSLNFSRNYCGSEGLNHLCDALVSTNCTLTSLNVSSNRFRDEDIMHLFTVLTSTNCTLTSLDVSWSGAGDRSVKELARALTNNNCALTSLDISWNGAGDRAVKDLARALTNKNCALTSLDIRYNEIGDEGIKYLCKALTDPNCKLRSLDLGGNEVTDVGKQFLSEAITGTDWEVREGLSLFRSIKSEA